MPCALAGVPFTAGPARGRRGHDGRCLLPDVRAGGRSSVPIRAAGLATPITGVGGTAKSRTPLIVLTADTQASAVRSNFKIDQDALARSVGAVSERIHSPATAVADTLRAFRTARNERRTVVLNLPLDVQSAPGPRRAPGRAPGCGRRRPAGPPLRRQRPAPRAPDQRRRAPGTLWRAAGHGMPGSNCSAWPTTPARFVAASAVANGLFHDEDFNLGISARYSLTAQRRADPEGRPDNRLGLRPEHVDHAARGT